MNNVFLLHSLHIDYFFACNPEWWEYYGRHPLMESRRDQGMVCYTWHEKTADRLGIRYIPGRWSGGPRKVTSLSTDPGFIHYGHGSGYETIGLAYALGYRRMLLVGYDLRYPKDAPRHFFGEYPKPLLHRPRTGPNGEMQGLLECYDTIDTEALGLQITNCSPGTSLTRFGVGDIEKELSACG